MVVLIGVVVVALAWAAARVARVVSDHRPRATRGTVALGVAWVVCAVAGIHVAGGSPVAAAGAAELAVDTVDQVRDGFADRDDFADQIAADGFADVPDDQLLTGLRGKDVLLVFVESYGRSATRGSSYSPGVEDVLLDGTRRLDAAGYDTRSGYLTSPTFGAGSWLAHSTTQSGLWVDSERRYGQLLGSDRLTLTSAFGRAGWRTVFDVPANTEDWPEGEEFYGYDHIYDSRNVDYAGPEFGYAPVPDQYTLEHFRREELASADRAPVFAEIDLISSHHPWTPPPPLVPWDEVGDGSVFDGTTEDAAPGGPGGRPGAGAAALRRLDPVLLGDPGVLPRDLPRPRPGAGGPRRPRAVVLGERRRLGSRRTDHRHRAGPRRRTTDRGLGLVARAAAARRRAGDWPMSYLRDRLLTAFGPG